MTNEAIAVQVPPGGVSRAGLSAAQPRRHARPDDVVVFALKAWVANRQGKSSGGYQWKELFLPDGSELRMRFRSTYYYARIDGDQLKSVSPRGWALMVTGTVRNPWRDIWIRRAINECWARASMWRSAGRFGAQFEQLFVQVLMLAREMGMLKLGKVSVDGSKVKANASKHSALSWGHLKKIEEQLQQEVQQLMALAESEDRKNVPDGIEVPKEIALRQQRLAVLDEAKRKLEERDNLRDLAAQAEYEGKLTKRHRHAGAVAS
jgi:hypothetical protein